jgi:hypothetical protein
VNSLERWKVSLNICQFEWILLLKKVKFVSRTRLSFGLQTTSRYNFLSKITRSDKWVVSLERWTGRLVAEISRHCVSLKMTIVDLRWQVSRHKENGLLKKIWKSRKQLGKRDENLFESRFCVMSYFSSVAGGSVEFSSFFQKA